MTVYMCSMQEERRKGGAWEHELQWGNVGGGRDQHDMQLEQGHTFSRDLISWIESSCSLQCQIHCFLHQEQHVWFIASIFKPLSFATKCTMTFEPYRRRPGKDQNLANLMHTLYGPVFGHLTHGIYSPASYIMTSCDMCGVHVYIYRSSNYINYMRSCDWLNYTRQFIFSRLLIFWQPVELFINGLWIWIVH